MHTFLFRLVTPKKHANGEAIQMSLASTCPDPADRYVAALDRCERILL